MSLAIKTSRAVAAGDPGLFGSIGRFLGGAARVVTGVAAQLVPGPLGAAARFAQRRIFTGARGVPASAIPGSGQFIGPPQPGQFVGGIGARGRSLTGNRRSTIRDRLMETAQITAAPRTAAAGTVPACMAGMRPNKSGYFLKSGQFVEPMSRCVKIRRRNPGNMRALDRSIGRIESAKRMSKKLGRIRITKECP